MGLSLSKWLLSSIKGSAINTDPPSPSPSIPPSPAAIVNAIDGSENDFVDANNLVQFSYDWQNLVCEGGGVKCLAACGAIKVLEVAGVLQKITRYAGSSGGSIVCMLLYAGYSADELIRLVQTTDFQKLVVTDTNLVNRVYSLVEQFGCYDGNAAVEWLGELLRAKGFDADITFASMHAVTAKTLVITGCNINTGETEFFSHHTTPLMPVRIAVRISISIPFLLLPVKWNESLYVDGGVFANYPIDAFDSPIPGDKVNISAQANVRTLGIKFIGADDQAGQAPHYRKTTITNVVQYGTHLFCRALDEIARLNMDGGEFWARTIAVPTGNYTAVDFELSKKQKGELFKYGKDACSNFLKKWVHEHQRRPSLLRWLRRASVGSLGYTNDSSSATLSSSLKSSEAAVMRALLNNQNIFNMGVAASPTAAGSRSPSRSLEPSIACECEQKMPILSQSQQARHCSSASVSCYGGAQMGGALTREQLEQLKSTFPTC